MCPKPADASVRSALVESAARLIATEGPGQLTLRRVAKEVGTSTMAVYTHFGGMDELRREVRREGFARLRAKMTAVPQTSDPVADIGMLGWAYYVNATDNPNLYRSMFMEEPIDEVDAEVGLDTFDQLVTAVQRCIDVGRFTAGNPVVMATQLWASMHGVVTLQLAQLIDPERAIDCLLASGSNLFTAFGDEPTDAGSSAAAIVDRAGG